MDLFTLVARLSLDASDYEKGVQSSKQSFVGLANTVSAKAVAVGTMVAHGVERAAGALFDFGKNAIQASADIEAEISLYHQVFGELESAATGALESISQDTNILSTRLRGIGTGAFMQFKGSGIDAGNALSMMDKYTRLAADAAAAYNISVEEADVKLRSFIRGNTEAGDSIGLFTSESQRNERAVANYGKKWIELTEAQKQMLMLGIVDEIYSQSEVIGQAAREGHEWENVIGNLNKAFTDLSAVAGSPFREVLIPSIEDLTRLLSDETISLRVGMLFTGIANIAGKAFDGAINLIDALIKWSNGEDPGEGFQIIEDIFSIIGNIGTAAYNGAKAVVDAVLGLMDSDAGPLEQAGEFFKDLKTLTESEGFNAIVSVLTGAFAIILGLNNPLVLVGTAIATIATNWKSVKDYAKKAWDAFQNFVNPIEVNLDAPTWDDVKGDIEGKINDIIEGIKGIANWTLGAFGLPDVDTIVKQVSDWWTGQGENTYERVKSVLKWTFGAFVAPSLNAIDTWWNGDGGGEDALLGLLCWTLGDFVAPAIADIITTTGGTIAQWAGDFVGGVVDFLDWTLGELNLPTVSDVVNKIQSWWNTVTSNLNLFFGATFEVNKRITSSPDPGTFDAPYTGSGPYDEGWGSDYDTGGETVLSKLLKKSKPEAVGLDYVPYDNFFARLHEGEAVLTKAEAADWRRGGSVQAIDYAAMGSAVGSAVREALSGIGLYTDDGTRIADMVTQRVSRNIAREAKNRRFAPVV